MDVVLVYTDRTRQTMTEDQARELCSNPATAGRIIDALTDDSKLQSKLRKLMDNATFPTP